MVPAEVVPSRVMVWPTWTLVVSGTIVATTSAAGVSAPVITTSSVPTPPLSEVTVTSSGGTGRFAKVQVVAPLVPRLGAPPENPWTERAAAGSPDSAGTGRVWGSVLLTPLSPWTPGPNCARATWVALSWG